MKDTITRVVNNCEICLQSKYERHPYNPKFAGPLLAKRPFDLIHLDTFSFLNSKFLTIIDLFSICSGILHQGWNFHLCSK